MLCARQLKEEIIGKPLTVAFDRFVEAERRDTKDARQVRIENNFLPAESSESAS